MPSAARTVRRADLPGRRSVAAILRYAVRPKSRSHVTADQSAFVRTDETCLLYRNVEFGTPARMGPALHGGRGSASLELLSRVQSPITRSRPVGIGQPVGNPPDLNARGQSGISPTLPGHPSWLVAVDASPRVSALSSTNSLKPGSVLRVNPDTERRPSTLRPAGGYSRRSRPGGQRFEPARLHSVVLTTTMLLLQRQRLKVRSLDHKTVLSMSVGALRRESLRCRRTVRSGRCLPPRTTKWWATRTLMSLPVALLVAV